MDRPTCDQLAAAIKGMGARDRDRYLRQYPWLDDFADIPTAAEFTGLTESAVRAYHTQAMTERRQERPGWKWPVPDKRYGGEKRGSPVWRYRTLVLARASMPGQGRGGPETRRKYDAATRDWIAGQVLNGHIPAAKAAADAGISLNTVRDWVKRARKAQAEARASSSP